MSTPERFNSANDEVYGGRRMTPIARAESIAIPRYLGSEGRRAQNLVYRPGETGGVNVQQTSFGMNEFSNGTARALGTTGDVVLAPFHWLVRVGATIISEMEKAKKMYVGGVVSKISEWQTPWGRVGAQLMTPVIAGAFALAVAQGVVWGGLKGTYGLLKDKAQSFVAHLSDNGETYFQSAAKSYTGHTAH
ncbi:hypothetical protein EPO14_01605 [Patescibacteria group bacterium]|nr:MAG: hypothetical protein EPO14_01605 [Patescibacteria group bacterium]